MNRWIKFDEIYKRLIVKPTKVTPLGLTNIRVTLSDSKSTSVYLYNLWIVINFEDQKPAKPINDPEDSIEPEVAKDSDPIEIVLMRMKELQKEILET